MTELKTTAISPANIAFIKYWGWRDQKLVLPNNDSVSMTMDNCLTTTTVEFSPRFKKDSVRIKFFGQKEKEARGSHFKRVINQVNRLKRIRVRLAKKSEQSELFNRMLMRSGRTLKDIANLPVKIVSHNSFPSDAGIAASASAFSALTLALASALGFKWSQKELSIETRLAGSGSACRSVVDGFAYWKKGKDSQSSYAYQLKNEK